MSNIEFRPDSKYLLKKSDNGRILVFKEGILLPNKPPALFKFFADTMYNLDALKGHYLYLSSPKNFNDPFDCNIKLLRPSRDSDLRTLQKELYRDFGVACLTEEVNNGLMWSYYTNYCGFVLQFDDLIFKNDDFDGVLIDRVIYPQNPKKMLSNSPMNALIYVMTTKLQEWEHENEWRIIANLKDGNRNLYYKTDNISAIYIGYRLKEQKPNVFNLLIDIIKNHNSKANIYIAEPHPSKLELQFTRV